MVLVLGSGRSGLYRDRSPLFQSLMRSGVVVVPSILTEGSVKLYFREEEEMVSALPLESSLEAFDECLCDGGPSGAAEISNAPCAEDMPRNYRIERGISIMPRLCHDPIWGCVSSRNLTMGDVLCPTRGWVLSHVCGDQRTRRNIHHHENEESREGGGTYGKLINGPDVLMSS